MRTNNKRRLSSTQRRNKLSARNTLGTKNCEQLAGMYKPDIQAMREGKAEQQYKQTWIRTEGFGIRKKHVGGVLATVIRTGNIPERTIYKNAPKPRRSTCTPMISFIKDTHGLGIHGIAAANRIDKAIVKGKAKRGIG